MAKAPGRNSLVSLAGTPIAGVTTNSIKWAGTFMDVTDFDADGIVTYLADVKTQQITLSVQGFYTSPTLRDIAFDIAASKLLTNLTFKFSDALTAKDTIAGNFIMDSYDENNPDDPTEFTCNFMSSGAWTLA